MSERVLSFEQAIEVVLEHARALASPVLHQKLPLLACASRVLAKPLTTERDHPAFDRSTRDGFAVRANDLVEGLRLQVVGAVRAGQRWTGAALAAGQAVEIMTGAPLAAGADAVLMVEHAVIDGDSLSMIAARSLRAGENVVPRGAEARRGDTLLAPGCLIDAPAIAVAASCGRAALEVFSRPTVAIVATGDELVELGDQPETWQIWNSNSYGLAALVQAEGAVAERLPVARDTREDLRAVLGQASGCDLLLLSGGVSMGKYDLVEEVLREHGAQFFFTGALIQPGKPIVFGRLPKIGEGASGEWTYFFGLPGNPVSTQVCFHLFVAPVLRALAGRTSIAPMFVEARLVEKVRAGAKVVRFLPAELTGSAAAASVRLIPWQGSGDLAANARANCYCVLPIREDEFFAGETLRVLLPSCAAR